MTTAEMKKILAKKLKDENTYFTAADISIKKSGERYRIVIKDYEHIPFEMYFTDDDDYFGFEVWVKNCFEDENIIYTNSKKEYKIKNALIQLGYYIGTRF